MRGVDKVDDDEAADLVQRRAACIAGKDPYFVHYYRINFDGTGLTPLTDARRQPHRRRSRRDMQYYVDTYSRVDLPPVIGAAPRERRQVAGRRAREAATSSALLATGWKRAGGVRRQGPRRQDGHLGRHHPADELRPGEEVSGHREHLRRAAGLVRAEDVRRCSRHAGAGRARLHRRADRRHGHVEPLEGVPRRRVEEPRRRRLPRSHPVAQGGRGEVPVLRHHARRHLRHVGRRAERDRRRCSSIRSSTRSRSRDAGCHDNRMDKIWWNEQWMGWPLGPQYAASSNVDNAHRAAGQAAARRRRDGHERRSVVDDAGGERADQGQQGLRSARHPRRGSRDRAAPYGEHKRFDFFVRHLLGVTPPAWTKKDHKASTADQEFE